METFPANTDVSIQILRDPPDLASLGEIISVEVAIYSEADELLGSFLGDAPEQGKPYFVVVPASLTQVEAGKRAVRQIVVTFTDITNRQLRRTEYVLFGEPLSLVVMENSFATYPRFVLEQSSLLNLAAWQHAPEHRKISALISAYRSITRMSLEYTPLDLDGKYRTGYETTIDPLDWQEMTASEFEELPPQFRNDLILAQILQANELLQGNVYAERMRAGVSSETIGESSVSFNSAAAQHSLGFEARQVLSQYISRAVRVVRV